MELKARYAAREIEQKWQRRWEADRIYVAERDATKTKWFALVMFPYPSASQIHVGHWYGYVPADAHARMKRMRGFNVVMPFGFDAFGLPAENYAIKNGIHPFASTMANIDAMREQMSSMGAAFDWSREVVSCHPDYYRWTQWLFLQLYRNGLAYKARAAANWCPDCNTVLANEQVIEGACERCGSQVSRRDLEQWFFRITRYAEELLDFSAVDWPEKIRIMQRNWIGRSEGAEIEFRSGAGDRLPVFTTRPDTVYGVTFLVLAPEHPLVASLTSADRRTEVEAYIATARRTSDIERTAIDRPKTGVPIGADAINPYTGERVPIWIADYVLATYGSGAVMGVPGHDQRDFEFARQYGIPIRVVVAPNGYQGEELLASHVDAGLMVNSAPFDGLDSESAMAQIIGHGEKGGYARATVTYRLRDWLVSRQRYWGAPIPIVYCPTHGEQAVPETDLPVLLPEDAEFVPTGESPLLRHERFLRGTCPLCGGEARRETDTMDTFVDSSWYFLRYVSPKLADRAWDPAEADYWLPVDQYMGGAEHAVLHLLYARFFTKALRDIGLISFDEPFSRLFNQGMIVSGGAKMSKSKGNAVAPEEQVARFGADVLRTYLMFLGPWDQGGDWNDQGIAGPQRFMQRVWSLVTESGARYVRGDNDAALTNPAGIDLRRTVHRAIQSVGDDLDRFRFNTAIAKLMTLVSDLAAVPRDVRRTAAWHEAIRALLLMLAPIAPHVAEELWEEIGGPYSIHLQAWPRLDVALAAVQTATIAVQVDGKVRDRIEIAVGAPEDSVREAAFGSGRVHRAIEGRAVRREIYIPGRMFSIVTG